AEALVERKIEAEDPRACDDVAAQVAVTSQRLHGESLKVEPLGRGRVVELRADSRCVRSIVSVAGIGLVFAGSHAERETGGYGPDRSDLPGAQQRIRNHAAGEAVSFADRQLVQCG